MVSKSSVVNGSDQSKLDVVKVAAVVEPTLEARTTDVKGAVAGM